VLEGMKFACRRVTLCAVTVDRGQAVVRRGSSACAGGAATGSVGDDFSPDLRHGLCVGLLQTAGSLGRRWHLAKQSVRRRQELRDSVNEPRESRKERNGFACVREEGVRSRKAPGAARWRQPSSSHSLRGGAATSHGGARRRRARPPASRASRGSARSGTRGLGSQARACGPCGSPETAAEAAWLVLAR